MLPETLVPHPPHDPIQQALSLLPLQFFGGEGNLPELSNLLFQFPVYGLGFLGFRVPAISCSSFLFPV
jgi:hypothetical protein